MKLKNSRMMPDDQIVDEWAYLQKATVINVFTAQKWYNVLVLLQYNWNWIVRIKVLFYISRHSLLQIFKPRRMACLHKPIDCRTRYCYREQHFVVQNRLLSARKSVVANRFDVTWHGLDISCLGSCYETDKNVFVGNLPYFKLLIRSQSFKFNSSTYIYLNFHCHTVMQESCGIVH